MSSRSQCAVGIVVSVCGCLCCSNFLACPWHCYWLVVSSASLPLPSALPRSGVHTYRPLLLDNWLELSIDMPAPCDDYDTVMASLAFYCAAFAYA